MCGGGRSPDDGGIYILVTRSIASQTKETVVM